MAQWRLSDTLSVAALCISIAGVVFTYQQTSVLREQLRLQELQVRPFVKIVPSFALAPGPVIHAQLMSENLGSIPAKVLYIRMVPWVDGKTSGTFVQSSAPDFLYEHKNGAINLPPIGVQLARGLLAKKNHLGHWPN